MMKKRILPGFAILGIMILTACNGKDESGTLTLEKPPVIQVDGMETESTTENEYANTVTVSNIREFVDSINNDTRVILKEGKYNIADLDGYTNDYLVEQSFFEYPELTIKGIRNLSLEAEEGASVEIVTEEAYAAVIRFESCNKTKIKGITCGHEDIEGSCTGSVLYAEQCRDFVVEDCSLYGCGTYGLETYETEEISVIGTDIYNCNESIFYFGGMTNKVSVRECDFFENYSLSLFEIVNSRDIEIKDTKIHDNMNDLVITGGGAGSLKFVSCRFYDNNVEPDLNAPGIATYENCDIEAGKTNAFIDSGIPEEPEEIEYEKTVTVSSIQELVENIGSNTRIICMEGEYNFSELDDGYVLYNVENMSIEAKEGEKVEIVTENEIGKAFDLQNCRNIRLKGLTCGHKNVQGTCSGSVIGLMSCSGVVVSDCRLYGCGTYGLETYDCTGIFMKNTDIYDCSDGILYLSDSEGIRVSNCHFYENNVSGLFVFWNTGSVCIENCEVNDNNIDSVENLIVCVDSYDILFDECRFYDNNYEPETEMFEGTMEFRNCQIGK